MNASSLVLLFAVALGYGCASTNQLPEDYEGPEAKFDEDSPNGSASLPEGRCEDDEPEAEKEPLIDRTQQTVHDVINAAARYFDSFFGTTDAAHGSNVSMGSLSVSGQYDDRNEYRRRARLRARIALPALKDRTRLILGRGDADEMIDGTANDNIDTLPGRFKNFEDEDWLIGVGYSRDQKVARGWDFSAGVKLTFPLEPYVRATYRWNRTYGDSLLWQIRPRVFAQSQRGAGASLTNTLDYAANTKWMFRSWTILQGEDEIEGMGWTQQFTAYHSISDRIAMSYNLFATGETSAEVPTQDYGFELRFRRRVSRDWFFVELLGFVSWPREFLDEERELNPGVGIEFEMQFGDWPGRTQSR